MKKQKYLLPVVILIIVLAVASVLLKEDKEEDKKKYFYRTHEGIKEPYFDGMQLEVYEDKRFPEVRIEFHDLDEDDRKYVVDLTNELNPKLINGIDKIVFTSYDIVSENDSVERDDYYGYYFVEGGNKTIVMEMYPLMQIVLCQTIAASMVDPNDERFEDFILAVGAGFCVEDPDEGYFPNIMEPKMVKLREDYSVMLPKSLVEEMDWKPGTRLQVGKTSYGVQIATRYRPTKTDFIRWKFGMHTGKIED